MEAGRDQLTYWSPWDRHELVGGKGGREGGDTMSSIVTSSVRHTTVTSNGPVERHYVAGGLSGARPRSACRSNGTTTSTLTRSGKGNV